MQRLEVSGVVRLIYRSLGVNGLSYTHMTCLVGYCKKSNNTFGMKITLAYFS